MAQNIYTQPSSKYRYFCRQLALILTLCCSAQLLHAYDFERSGIYYNLNKSDYPYTASVTYKY